MGHKDLLVTQNYRDPMPNARVVAREASAEGLVQTPMQFLHIFRNRRFLFRHR